MSRITVSKCAYHHISDIDENATFHVSEWEQLANVCIARATGALEVSAPQYDDFQRHHLGDVIRSMSATHRTIRKLLSDAGSDKPQGVDVLPLVRLQLESLYTICLMLDDPKWINVYLQDHWRGLYIGFLLTREETQMLPRWHEFARKAPLFLTQLRGQFGITPEQQFTIDHEELGTPLPPGFEKQPIPKFPTPGRALTKIATPEKRKMLERLYPYYVWLCSFAHGLPQANFYKMMFDRSSFHRTLITDEQAEERFLRMASDAVMMSFFSIVQCTAELVTLYPSNVDLFTAATKAWNPLAEAHLLARAIWAIRTKKLLGIISV